MRTIKLLKKCKIENIFLTKYFGLFQVRIKRLDKKDLIIDYQALHKQNYC